MAQASIEDWGIKRQGKILARLTSYTDHEIPNYGQLASVELEQNTSVSDKLSSKNQIRWKCNSITTDISQKLINHKKDSYEINPGDNYIKYKNDDLIAQAGYQDVVWGEAFGFNYADIINPKDHRETLFADADEARLSLLLFNGKKLFSNGSIQVLYSPEPRFSKTLPFDLFIGDKFPQSQIELIKEKTPNLFKNSEAGGKISYSYNEFDTSLFHYSYLDRDPHYAIISSTNSTLTFQEQHNRIHSTGLSLAKTIGGHVLRTDIVHTQNKSINYFNSNQVMTYQTNENNFLISLDTPSLNNYSGALIFAQSSLQDINPLTVRNKNEQYSIAKLTKSLNEDKTFEIVYSHEYQSADNSIQALVNWPVNNAIDLRIGGQLYWGSSDSNFNKYKKLNSVFFSLKNYFQL